MSPNHAGLVRLEIGLAGALLILALLMVPSAAHGQQNQAPPACDEVEGFHKLDFWVGQWTVEAPDGTPQGTNRIEKVLGGCAILEHWEGAGGGAGKSLFFYNHVTDTWKQVWVNSRATAPGGLKEKELVEELADGGVRFQGSVSLSGGRTVLDRTTLTPIENGRVRQVIEFSRDDGETWQPLFTGIYIPRED